MHGSQLIILSFIILIFCISIYLGSRINDVRKVLGGIKEMFSCLTLDARSLCPTQEGIWNLVRLHGFDTGIIDLLSGLYSGTESVVKCGEGGACSASFL